MNLVYLTLGVLLLVSAVGDLLWTTLWVEGGAGPITTRVMKWMWQGFRRVAEPQSRALSLAGPVILVLTTLGWLMSMWAGWTFVFASVENPIIDTLNRRPITWSDRIYFTGYTVFTLGIGDYVPRDGAWQVITVLTTASGMLFVTLSVTYILSVLDAVTQKRSFANDVTGLGMQSGTIVQRSWDGEQFRGLDLPLNTITTQLNTLTANHKAYPILHYFYNPESKQAPTVSVAILDDALTLLQFGVQESKRPAPVIVENARSSIETYLDTLEPMVQTTDQTPPPLDLSTLRDAGIPTVSPSEFDKSLDELEERRRELLTIVQFDAREWTVSNDRESADFQAE